MRKGLRIFLIVVLIGALGVIGYLAMLNFPVSTIVAPGGSTNTPEPDQAPPVLDISEPRTLIIPTLGIEADIQHVGLTASGNMATPSGVNKYREVAWYKAGPRPGQEGSSVIAGHLDNGLGLDAIFYNLERLVPGDEVVVMTEAGETVRFRVLGQEIYDYKDAPSEKIFKTHDGRALLNLITCDGTWIQSEKSYDKRLVVYTELVGVEKSQDSR